MKSTVECWLEENGEKLLEEFQESKLKTNLKRDYTTKKPGNVDGRFVIYARDPIDSYVWSPTRTRPQMATTRARESILADSLSAPFRKQSFI